MTAATSTLVGGQLVFIVLALLGGLLAVGQGLSRHHAAGSAEQQIEAALGLTRGERVLARVGPGLLGAAVAAAVTVVGTLLAGLVEPLGPLREYEPEPGWLPEPVLVVLGALLVAVAFLLLDGPDRGPGGAARARRVPGSRAPRSGLTWLGRAGARPGRAHLRAARPGLGGPRVGAGPGDPGGRGARHLRRGGGGDLRPEPGPAEQHAGALRLGRRLRGRRLQAVRPAGPGRRPAGRGARSTRPRCRCTSTAGGWRASRCGRSRVRSR